MKQFQNPIILLGVMVTVAGALYVVFQDREAEFDSTVQVEASASPTPRGAEPESEPAPTSSPVTLVSAGSYIEYQSGIIEKTSGKKILFFHAPWCPQCRALEASIEKEGVPAGASIIKVDYDTNQALRQKYGVTIQTTLVRVNDQGELEEKFVAYQDPSLQAVVDKLL